MVVADLLQCAVRKALRGRLFDSPNWRGPTTIAVPSFNLTTANQSIKSTRLALKGW